MFFMTILALIGLVVLIGGCVLGALLVRERVENAPVEVLAADPHRDALSAVERMQAEMFSAAQALRRAERGEEP